ncbi:unnamed protein product [Orchesella dallaii]|uniref:Uncharacterized protein n=1 Tax=Orchesella dallaii TaxID=48710 RepID=A0ABP1PUP7_9HEXA
MNALISLVVFTSALLAANAWEGDDLAGTNKVHLFVLLVPDTTVQELKKARQEDAAEAGLEITETGAYVGQIISGVLGGDVRPIFAGSASFIGEEDVQQGVSTILANVAPSLNMILKQWVGRVQTALGIGTTPQPGTLNNGTGPVSNGASPPRPAGSQVQGQPQQVQFEQRQNPSTESYAYEHTTVEPLPLLKLKQPDDDNEEESDQNKILVNRVA